MKFSGKSFASFLAFSLATSLVFESAVAENRHLRPATLEPVDSAATVELPPDIPVRIVGGNDAAPGDYPYYVQTDEGCGGALIHPNVILTAAHCPEPDGLVVGNTEGSAVSNPGTDGAYIPLPCQEYAIHPDYNDDGKTYNNDWALCYLNVDALINEDDVKVKVSFDDNFLDDGDTLRIIGMGDTSEGGSPPTDLQFADVPYVDFDICNTNYAAENYPLDENTEFCAGRIGIGGVDTCQGDSGGPIFKVKSNKGGSETHTIVGVTSWGRGCARQNFPGVYASTSGGADWIKQTICDDWGLDASLCASKSSKASKASKTPGTKKARKSAKNQNCDVTVDIKVVTDVNNAESSWKLVNDASGSIVAQATFSTPESENQFTVEGLCSGESYTSVLEDSWKDGQVHCVFCPAQLLEVSHDGNTIFEVPDSWGGKAIESDPFTLGTDGDDCDFEIEINLVTDYFPSETFWEILQKDGSVVAGVAPGTYDDEFTAYAETVSDLCPGEYVFKLGDTHGDGQSGCSDILVLIAPQYPDGTNCPVPGMIGELSDGGDVLFDEIRYWGGDSLRATFVVP